MRNKSLSQKLSRSPTSLVIAALLTLTGWIRAEMWRVPVTVTNGAGISRTVEFGVHPDATTGLDPQLGEVNLPPWPPQQVFDVRFLVAGYQGFALDLRDTTLSARTHDLKWQAGSGGYPMTIHWDRTRFGTGIFTVTDVFGGAFIPPINMAAESLIVVPASQNFIRELFIEVIPQLSSPQSPALSEIPEQHVFTGQRFPHLHLSDYVSDPDTPLEQLVWSTTAQPPLATQIYGGNVLDVDYPSLWEGTGSVNVTVRDPEGNADSSVIAYSVAEGGVVRWSVPILVQDSAGGMCTLFFGVDPEATVGIDSALGEINLPPPPPIGVFDARFEVENHMSTRLDLRPSVGSPRVHTLRWQSGEDGYPVTVSWDSSALPTGNFEISDELGGIAFPPTDMRQLSELVVPESLSTVTAFLINVVPEGDTEPPTSPANLRVISSDSVVADLAWEPAADEHFAYYEVMIDTFPFSLDAQWIWDWSDDSLLANSATEGISVRYPDTSLSTYFFRVRAWDQFENHSVVSNLCAAGLPSVEQLRGRRSGSDVRLYWSPLLWASSYSVYRGDDPGVTPNTGLLVGTTSDTTFAEPLVSGAKAFYAVTATVQ